MIETIYNEPVINAASLYLKITFGNARAIGFRENGGILGGVIYNNYQIYANGSPCSMEASVFVLDKRIINRYNLRTLFDYPFSHANVERLCIRSGRSDKKKRKLIERLGFTYEGIARKAWPFGGDAAVYSMLKHECIWISHGKLSQPPASARSRHDGGSANGLQSNHG